VSNEINPLRSLANQVLPDTTLQARTRKAAAEPSDSYAPPESFERVPEFAQKYFTHGNRVTSLFDASVTPGDEQDEIFKQVKDVVKGAHKSIQVEMFSLEQKALVDLLVSEVKKGIDVQVIMDPPNEAMEDAKKQAIEALRKGGVKVLLYPVKEAGSEEAKYGQINHVKMLLVDGKTAIIGGMNWGEHSPNNHDYDVKVEGPTVSKMGWLFREDWITSGGDKKDLPYIGEQQPIEGASSWVNLIVSGLDERERTIGKTIRRSIDNAKKSVHAELFVLTERATIASLIKAKQRGVDVKVILNPLKIGENAVNEKAYGELKDAGVKVKWYNPNEATQEKLHAKMGVFDGDQVIVGSANWSYAGFNVNREADVEIHDPEVGSEFDTVFASDWKNKTVDHPIYLDEADRNAGG